MSKTSQKKSSCPFLDKVSESSCRLSASGLIIPTSEHILNYCKNESYYTCHHFIQSRIATEQNIELAYDDRPASNRRRHMRIPTYQPVRISRIHTDTNKEETIDNGAASIDLSLGGMRLETKAYLDPDETISFFFGEGNDQQYFKGKGDVKWIHAHESDEIIQVGLSFNDQETSNAVHRHLTGLGL